MKVSKDLSVTRNDNNLVSIFSWSLGKTVIITDSELPLLIEALQIEYAAQQSVQADGAYCSCENPDVYIDRICQLCGLPHAPRR